MRSARRYAPWHREANWARPGAYAVEHLIFTNNMALHNEYGVKGQGTAVGTPSLTAHTVGFTWTNNVLAGGAGFPYPPVTWMPTVVEYRGQFQPDYTLMPNSPFQRLGIDGLDLGFDGVVRPVPLTPPGNLRLIAR